MAHRIFKKGPIMSGIINNLTAPDRAVGYQEQKQLLITNNMKKLIYSAAAMALAFFAASCQQENLEPVASSNTVTYTVQVADAVATRAIGDDVTAVNELVYEVYRTEAEETTEFTNVDNLLYHKTAEVKNGVATIEIEFVNDQNFTVLFWAHTKDNGVYNVENLTNVTITSPDVANNVNAQAFVGRDFVRDCVSDQNGKVTLHRPVSQLNIATTPESLVFEAETGETGSTVVLEGSSVKVTGLATSYNIATLSAFGATATEYTYTEEDVPADVLTVNGKNYTYVAMNYVGFAPEMGTSDVTVSYVINTSEGNIDNEILNVPVKPNYRTNIIGNLITSKTDYTIELDKTWGEGDYYGPEFVKTPAYDEATKTWTITCRDELLYVAQQVNTGANSFVGQTVKVVNDIDLKNIPWTPIGHSTSVTFRGMFEGAAVTKAATEYPTISNLKIENGNCSGFFGLMCNGGKVRNINFNYVTISGERQLGVVVGQVYGNLEQPTIENVTVENAVITAVPALDGTVYDNGDKVGGIAGLIGQNAYIKGCTVKNSTFTGYRDMGGIVGCTQNGYPCNLTGNHSENIDFVVTSQYVPYSGNTPHGATGAIRGGTRSNAADVIEGNTSSEGTISEVVLVNDQVSLQNAINAAVGETHIKFASDITGNVSVTVIQKPGVKININGDNKKYNGFIKVHSNSNHYADAALTIKNVNFETSVASTNFIEALENGSERYSTNITVNECTFTATGEAVNTAVGVQIKASKNAKVIKCTATDMHSLIQAQSCDETVVVTGCTVNGKNGVAFKQVKAATVEGTTITATAYGIRFDGNTDNYGILVKENNVTAVQPLIVRKMTGANNTITLEGTNTLTTEAEYHIVITNGSDDEEYSEPTGTYILTGAGKFNKYPQTPVAKVGNTVYLSIDEAVANWTNGSTLTLIDDVTLSDVITLKSTEHHILNLGTYTLTAASGKHAIEITCNGRTNASYALTVNADATNPGGITATGKSCIYYKKSDSTKDRPIILINNGVFTGSYSINSTSNGNTNCPQIWINGGVFNSYMNLTKNMLKVSGGTFHGAINCTGDSSAYRQISGGRFKSWQFMTADADNKFWVGTAKATYDVGVYVDDEGYLVVGGPVITEFGDKFAAKATNYSKWSSYLKYSSAATNGLYYTNAAAAIAKHGEANVVLK